MQTVGPELCSRSASQWKQTMSTLPNRGRGEVLASCSRISFTREEPDTLFITLDDNWYRSLSSDKKLMESISDAIAAKYGVCPKIRFVNASQGGQGSLTQIGSKVQEKKKKGIMFPIDVE